MGHAVPRFALSAALVAIAASPSVFAAETRDVVRLVLAAGDDEAAALEASLRELLGRVGVTLASTRVDHADGDDAALPSPPPLLAVAWVDLRRPSRAAVVLVDPRTGRVVARRDVPREQSSAIVVEDVAQIVRASVEALADADRTPPVVPPPPAAPPSPPRVSPAPVAFAGGAFATARFLGPGANVVAGGGATFGLVDRRRWWPSWWLWGAYHVPVDVTGSLVDVHVSAWTLRLAPTVRLLSARRWFVEVGPTVGVDAVTALPRSDLLPSGRLRDGTTSWSPTLGALATARFFWGNRWGAFVAGMADLDVVPPRYVLRVGPGTETVFAGARLQPALLAGVTLRFAGEGHEAGP